MIINEEDIYEYLYVEHFGVRGMHWGIRKKEETSNDGKSSLQKDLEKHPPKPLSKEEKANVAKNAKKFDDQKKDPDDESDSKGWRPTKKQLITIGVGAAAAALIVGGTYKYLTAGSKPYSESTYKAFAKHSITPEWMHQYAGQKVTPAEYKGLVEHSRGRIWSKHNFITAKSFEQKEQVFSAGHKFFRVSHSRNEEKFGFATYMLPNEKDLARYHLGWKSATTNIIDFNAKDTVKVPDLHTRLEAMREVMHQRGERGVTPHAVMKAYSQESGGSWQTPLGLGFFENLKKKGFHAIVDDMDAGVYGENPLVLFDQHIMTPKHTTPFRDINIDTLKSILTEIPNRR